MPAWTKTNSVIYSQTCLLFLEWKTFITRSVSVHNPHQYLQIRCYYSTIQRKHYWCPFNKFPTSWSYTKILYHGPYTLYWEKNKTFSVTCYLLPILHTWSHSISMPKAYVYMSLPPPPPPPLKIVNLHYPPNYNILLNSLPLSLPQLWKCFDKSLLREYIERQKNYWNS